MFCDIFMIITWKLLKMFRFCNLRSKLVVDWNLAKFHTENSQSVRLSRFWTLIDIPWKNELFAWHHISAISLFRLRHGNWQPLICALFIPMQWFKSDFFFFWIFVKIDGMKWSIQNFGSQLSISGRILIETKETKTCTPYLR